MNIEELKRSLGQMRSVLIAVATGGPRIGEVNDQYQYDYEETSRALSQLGLENPNPHRDLWDWYGRWSSGDLPTYQSRRNYVAEIFDPLLAQFKAGKTPATTPEPTGWARVDRALGKARDQLAEAREAEDFQAIGLFCREVLISLAQEVHDPERHPFLESIKVSDTDYKRRIEAYIQVELGGNAFEDARRHAKSALDLALALQHKRSAKFRDAAICVESTGSVVNIIAIMSGRRDP